MKSNDGPINEDVFRLLESAYSGKAGGRLFTVIVDFLQRRHEEMTASELALMSEILTRLLGDVELNLRQKLARRLAGDEAAPVELIILLANDRIEVATPVLSLSPLLSDRELTEIIRHKTAQHQLAISCRDQLSAHICQELITVGNSKTLITLLNNPHALIDKKSFSVLVEKSKKNLPLQPPLIERADLPASLAARMYHWVSGNLKQSILANFHLEAADIDRHVSAAIAEAAREDSRGMTREKSEILLIDKLNRAGRLKPSFLVKCLFQGQSSLFEIAFSKMIAVPLDVMRSLLYDRDIETLAVVCCAAGIDRSVFMTVYRLTRSARNLTPDLADDDIARILAYYTSLERNKALATIQKWSRQS